MTSDKFHQNANCDDFKKIIHKNAYKHFTVY